MRHLRRRKLMAIVTVATFTLLILMIILRPEPRLSETFGATSAPPPDALPIFASVKIDFSSPLRRLVVLKNVEFRDSSGTYTLVQPWVNAGVGGGVFYAETLDEYKGFELVDVPGYRLRDVGLMVILKLQPTGTTRSSHPYAGPNQIILKYTLAGWPITRQLSWDPNDR